MKSILKTLLLAFAALCGIYARGTLALALTPSDVHIDVPLSNIAIEAFSTGDFIGPQLFPIVPVQKQSDKYYTIKKETWLRVPSTTRRDLKQSPARIEFDVSSDSYYAENYALATDNALETLANADDAIQLRARATRFLVDALMRDLEVRIANLVTSVSNVGSGVVLSGGAKWSNYASSDPVSDVTTGHAFIRQNTGLIANTLLLDMDTYQTVRRHPVLLDMYKYTQGGLVNDAELAAVFKVDKLLIGAAVRNMALEGSTAGASMVNIWGNNAILAYVSPAAIGMRTATFGIAFQWQNPELPAAFGVRTYPDPDPGKKNEVIEVGYYQSEKVVAPTLAYSITTTL